MSIRVLVSLPAPSATEEADPRQLAGIAERLRATPGWVEAEGFAVVGEPARRLVIGLCDQDSAIAAATGVLGEAVRPGVGAPGSVEAYPRARFGLTDGVWTPASTDGPAAVVHGAHHGTGVRVVIQRAFAETDEVTERLVDDTARAREEAGCVEYAWARSVENPEHFALVELWETQRLYDEHWSLRLVSGKAGRRVGGEDVARASGENSVEFYRHQALVEHYGRWLPSDVRRRSTAVQWGI